jgi:hypothetical protein
MTTTVAGLDRLTGITDPGQVAGDDERHPDPGVPARARRRTFTAQYKREILAAYDAAPGGEKGAESPHAARVGVRPARWVGRAVGRRDHSGMVTRWSSCCVLTLDCRRKTLI